MVREVRKEYDIDIIIERLKTVVAINSNLDKEKNELLLFLKNKQGQGGSKVGGGTIRALVDQAYRVVNEKEEHHRDERKAGENQIVRVQGNQGNNQIDINNVGFTDQDKELLRRAQIRANELANKKEERHRVEKEKQRIEYERKEGRNQIVGGNAVQAYDSANKREWIEKNTLIIKKNCDIQKKEANCLLGFVNDLIDKFQSYCCLRKLNLNNCRNVNINQGNLNQYINQITKYFKGGMNVQNDINEKKLVYSKIHEIRCYLEERIEVCG